jgi:hypothetical protein
MANRSRKRDTNVENACIAIIMPYLPFWQLCKPQLCECYSSFIEAIHPAIQRKKIYYDYYAR